MGLVDDLVANPGLCVGSDTVAGTELVGAARIVVPVPPGRVGVSLDHEVLDSAGRDPIRGHAEHTISAERTTAPR